MMNLCRTEKTFTKVTEENKIMWLFKHFNSFRDTLICVFVSKCYMNPTLFEWVFCVCCCSETFLDAQTFYQGRAPLIECELFCHKTTESKIKTRNTCWNIILKIAVQGATPLREICCIKLKFVNSKHSPGHIQTN